MNDTEIVRIHLAFLMSARVYQIIPECVFVQRGPLTLPPFRPGYRKRARNSWLRLVADKCLVISTVRTAFGTNTIHH